MNTKTIVHWIFYIIFVTGLIIAERFYKTYLFDISLSFIEQLQEYTSSPIVRTFFKVTSMFGGELIFVKIFITFIFYPINKSFLLIFIFSHCDFIVALFQMIYTEPRPFLIDDNIDPYVCLGDFGNPSDHAAQSVGIYLGFWHITTDDPRLRDKLVFRLFTLFGMCVFILFILFSRLILGVQTINQLLFGLTFGFALYYLFFILLDFHKMKGKEFFEHLQYPAYKALYICLMICCFLSMLFVYLFYRRPAPEEWKAVLQIKCKNLHINEYFQNQALTMGTGYFMHIGTYFGLLILISICNDKYEGLTKWDAVNEWTTTGFGSSVLRLFFIASIISVPLMVHIFMLNTYNYWVVTIFKYIIPYFSMFILAFSLGVHFSVGIGIANQNIIQAIKKEDIHMNDNDEKILML